MKVRRGRVTRAAAAVACWAALGCTPALAATLDLDKFDTKDVTLIWFAPEEYLTPHIGRSFENALQFHEKMLGWQPWDKTTILLTDFKDWGNANARAVPTNGLNVDIAPMSQAFETFSGGERFYTLMNHEMMHVSQMDAWNDEDAFWRRFFHGKPLPIIDHPESILYNYLATPRAVAPRWFFEGTAVFMETWMGGGLGRAQGPYDEMVFRTMVRDNSPFYSPLGLESQGEVTDFQVMENAYLYGERFVTYLALTRGPEKVIEWMKRGPNSDRYYSTQFQDVFGESLDQGWQDWIAWEHKHQQESLKQVRQYPVTPTKKLAPRALGSVSRSFYDPATDSLIGGFRYPGVIAHIGVLSLATGEEKKLVNIKDPILFRVTSFAYDPQSHKAYYTADNVSWRTLMEVDTVTGDTRVLCKACRVGELALNRKDGSLWGVRHDDGLVTIVRFNRPETGWNKIFTFPYGTVASDLDVSPDGTLLSATVGEINGDETVRVYKVQDLEQGKLTEVSRFSFASAFPENFVFSPDGRYLYGSSFYTGVSNIYRYEIATGKTEAVSNAVTGFFRPIPRADGSLIVYEYTGQGYLPVIIDKPKPLTDLGTVKFLGAEVVEQHPIVKTWDAGSPARIPLESMITDRGKYKPWDELALDSTYPVVLGYKGHVAAGWYAMFEDPVGFTQLQADVAYSPDVRKGSERWHAFIDYHDISYHLRYWHNYSNFYDLFGPTDRSRRGDAFIAGYNEILLYDLPRRFDLKTEVAYYSDLDTLPGAQNVHSNTLDKNIVEAKGSLIYTNTDQSYGSIDYEQGWRGNINVQTDYADQKIFPRAWGGVDFGFALPWWNHSSLWLYNAAGISGGAHLDPLNPFYLGAFGNNFVDNGEVKRYRNYDSFPGFDIDAISARTFVKSVAEWNFPPIRFAELGTPSFYLSSIRSAAFGGVLLADPGMTTDSMNETLGAQIDLNFTIALRLPMTLSFGYAHGFSDTFKKRDELMASLKIL